MLGGLLDVIDKVGSSIFGRRLSFLQRDGKLLKAEIWLERSLWRGLEVTSSFCACRLSAAVMIEAATART